MSAFWKDALERVAWTFVQGFAAALLAAGAFDLTALQTAAFGGLTAALAFVKVFVAQKIGDPNTAAIGV